MRDTFLCSTGQEDTIYTLQATVTYFSKHMRKVYLSHRQSVKAQASLQTSGRDLRTLQKKKKKKKTCL